MKYCMSHRRYYWPTLYSVDIRVYVCMCVCVYVCLCVCILYIPVCMHISPILITGKYTAYKVYIVDSLPCRHSFANIVFVDATVLTLVYCKYKL